MKKLSKKNQSKQLPLVIYSDAGRQHIGYLRGGKASIIFSLQPDNPKKYYKRIERIMRLIKKSFVCYKQRQTGFGTSLIYKKKLEKSFEKEMSRVIEKTPKNSFIVADEVRGQVRLLKHEAEFYEEIQRARLRLLGNQKED